MYFPTMEAAHEINAKDKYGYTSLHTAARKNDVTHIKHLLSKGANVNAKGPVKWTPLHMAAIYNQGDSYLCTIETLLKNGADVNALTNYQETPLHYLVPEADVKTIKLYLSYSPDIKLQNNRDENVLFNAARNDNFKILQQLVDYGADLSTSNVYGSTVFHETCSRVESSERTIKCLLKNGADLNAPDRKGRTPLIMMQCNLLREKNRKKLTFLLKYSEVFKIDTTKKSTLKYCNRDPDYKIVLEHIAKLLELNSTVDSSFHDTINSERHFKKYFNQYSEELLAAKSTKLRGTWITLFNLLVDSRRKLKNYAGNQDLIKDFKNSGYEKKFPIYGAEIKKNVDKGIKRRKLFDRASITLSDCLPIFNPNHLIVRDILDCVLSRKDLNKLCTRNRIHKFS